MDSNKRTPLYQRHLALGAKMVPFAGFMMPIEYSGIMAEHKAVRSEMGMFDLSHMGEVIVRGIDAVDSVDRLVTNDVCGLEVGQARYTPMCLPAGGILDDLLIYRFESHLMLVINASNTSKDVAWIDEQLSANVEVSEKTDQIALIAIQGPRAVNFVQTQSDVDILGVGYYHFVIGEVAGVPATVSRTGYTGEDGVELYVEASKATAVWDALLNAGRPEGLVPVGLGARDTLRLEAGLALFGNDIDEQTTPLEAGLGWTVKLDKEDFVGREALVDQKARGLERRLVAFEMLDRAIPRPHYSMKVEGVAVGAVRSGTFSPTFSKGIGMGYVEAGYNKVGTELAVEIRGKDHPARVVRKPIYQRPG